jgi:hypothetical protein
MYNKLEFFFDFTESRKKKEASSNSSSFKIPKKNPLLEPRQNSLGSEKIAKYSAE